MRTKANARDDDDDDEELPAWAVYRAGGRREGGGWPAGKATSRYATEIGAVCR